MFRVRKCLLGYVKRNNDATRIWRKRTKEGAMQEKNIFKVSKFFESLSGLIIKESVVNKNLENHPAYSRH